MVSSELNKSSDAGAVLRLPDVTKHLNLFKKKEEWD